MLCCCLNLQNIVHGDIKPDNLLITGSGSVKIGDFSVSQVAEVRETSVHLPLVSSFLFDSFVYRMMMSFVVLLELLFSLHPNAV